MARLFISHSSADNAAALALRDWLSEQGFDDVFLDVDPTRGLVAGERWQEALKAAADRCEAVLFLVSPAWLASKWCLAEFLLAKTLHKRIFGLVVDPVPIDQVPTEMTSEWQLCELVGQDPLRSFDVTVGATPARVAFREAGLDLLRRGLQRAGLDAASFPWPPPGEPKRAPYRGLRALEPQDAAIFFGRDAAIVRGLDRIRGLAEGGVERLFVVLGASGSGKSSFLRAGLWPRLVRDDAMFLPLPAIRPETAVITGGSGLAVAFAGAFARLGEQRPAGHVKAALAEGAPGFARLTRELVALAKRRLVAVDGERPGPVLVLPLDQAEELFNPDGADEAKPFLDMLAGVLRDSGATSTGVLVVATMRSDRYEQLQREPSLVEVKQALFNLPPIAPAEFKSVIEGPARRVADAGGKLRVEPGLTERLIEDALGADALPLLGFTLERLYADYGSDGLLSVSDYEAIGGVQGSIAAAVAHALADPGRKPAIPADREAQFAALRAAFIPWLARINPETGAPMRRVARRDEIPQGSRTMVERLIEARLIVADRRQGVDTIEVTHESLLRQWPALAAWLEHDADDLKAVDGIENAAAEWARNGRLEAWLAHRAERLAAADKLAARDDFRRRLGEEGAAYLAACHAREAAERKEREEAIVREQERLVRTARLQRRVGFALGALILVVILGLGAVGWLFEVNRQQQQANDRTQIKLLLGLARAERLQGNFVTALRLALHGVRKATGRFAEQAPAAEAELIAAVWHTGWSLLLAGHDRAVNSAAFSPDGRRIITGGNDGMARIWDAATGKQLAVIDGHKDWVQSVAFTRDGRHVLTASDDRTARIWDAGGKEVTVMRGHKEYLRSAAFNRDESRVVTGSDDQTARIWDAATGRELAVLQGHTARVRAAAFSPDGRLVVTASDDRTARIWEAGTGKELRSLQGHRDWVRAAAFSPDGTRVLTGSDDSTLRLWDAVSGKELSVLRGHEGWIRAAAFNADGTRIASGSDDTTVRVWDAASGRELAVLRGHENFVLAVAFSPDGSRIVSGSQDRTVRVWDDFTGREVFRLAGHSSPAYGAAFSPDGALVATGSQDQTARIWNAATGKEVRALKGHRGSVYSAAFSPDGKLVLTASRDETARVWDLASGKELFALNGHDDPVRSASYSRDGTRIVTASEDKTARVWDAASRRAIATLSPHDRTVRSAAFSPDGKRVVTGSDDKMVRLWDAATGELVRTMSGHEDYVRSVAFSPDGRLILTASDDRTARLWDSETGREVAVLLGHRDYLRSAAFSPDGRRLVTASDDRTMRIWDTGTARELGLLRGHQDFVNAVAFSPDGARLITASEDHSARIWDVRLAGVPVGWLIGHVCERLLGPLSRMNRNEMRMAEYSDEKPEIDDCAGAR